MGSVVSRMIGKGLLYFLRLIDVALLARCVLSWFVSPYSRVMQFFVSLTEPFVAPCRRLLNRMTGGRPSLFAGLGFVPGGLFIVSSVAALLPTVVSEWCFWVIPVLFGLAMRHMAARWHRLPR